MDILARLLTNPITITLIVTLGYLGMCLIWPFKRCRRCGGRGRFDGPFRSLRLCRRCDGSGLKLRTGRRLINASQRARRQMQPTRRRSSRIR